MDKFKDYYILPIGKCLAYLGNIFTLFFFLCLLIYSKESSVRLFIICVIALFLLVFLAFITIGIKDYLDTSEDNTYDGADDCEKCVGEVTKDRFHAKGLLEFDELTSFEKQLSLSSSPQCCKVLVYTSDLATEYDAEDAVNANIDKGVQYIVLYFKNSCSYEDFNKIKKKYGEDNLVDLSEHEDFKNSFDGQLAEKLGFDIMIYQNEEGLLKGYFAVDFVPEKQHKRQSHVPYCKEQCNYGKWVSSGKKVNPFYKEFSFEITKQLYDEGLEIHKKFLNDKKQKHGQS